MTCGIQHQTIVHFTNSQLNTHFSFPGKLVKTLHYVLSHFGCWPNYSIKVTLNYKITGGKQVIFSADCHQYICALPLAI